MSGTDAMCFWGLVGEATQINQEAAFTPLPFLSQGGIFSLFAEQAGLANKYTQIYEYSVLLLICWIE